MWVFVSNYSSERGNFIVIIMFQRSHLVQKFESTLAFVKFDGASQVLSSVEVTH